MVSNEKVPVSAVDPLQKSLRFLPESKPPQTSDESKESFEKEKGGKSQSASFEKLFGSLDEKSLRKLIKEKGYKIGETKDHLKKIEVAEQEVKT